MDEALRGIAAGSLLADGGRICAETAADEGFDVPAGLALTDQRRYGKSLLHFIERA